MKFRLEDLKAILPTVQIKKGDRFLMQIKQTIDDSTNLGELETSIEELFDNNDLNYSRTVASSTLRAGEPDSNPERKVGSNPLQNELIEIIDKKAEEFKQNPEDSAQKKESTN